MISTQTARPDPLATTAGGVVGLVRRAWHAFWDWRAKRLTVHILRSLDDRTLRDIGISPGEISSVVYGRPGDRRHRYHESWRCCGGA
jgi:uncharacterized protein YjiS (DUF1127 family)